MKYPGTKQDGHSPYVQLRHRAAEMEVGTTDNRSRCPFCEGGRSGDRAFALTRVSESEARYCCHRATCGKSGRVATWGFRLRQEVDNSPKDSKSFTPRLYIGDTGELEEPWSAELLVKYDLQPEETSWANWREDIDSKRLVCPVYGPDKVLRGYELRFGKWQAREGVQPEPKTSHYRSIDAVWMGWFRRTKTGPVLLVEDCISALKGSRHFQSASLMGSHISLDHVLEAVEVSQGEPILVALDKDATDKAFKYISQWRFIAPNFVPCTLSKDLKYYTDQDILELNHV